MNGKRVVITGATSGIGLEAARQIAATGASLVLACRNREKAEKVAVELDGRGDTRVGVVHLDLSSLQSVRRCAAELVAQNEPIHVLVNNAGTFAMSRQETEDGFELTLGVNYLGPFLLTNLLLPVLRRVEHARVVNVASAAYRYAKLHLDDLQRTRWHGGMGWGGFQAYAASRLATVLFTRELAARLAPDGITANGVHPGHVQTGIFPQARGLMGRVMELTARSRISAAEGAQPVVRLACDEAPAGVTGEYFNRFEREEVRGQATDTEFAHRLWDVSAQLTGLEE